MQVNQAAGQSFSGPAVLSTLAGKGTLTAAPTALLDGLFVVGDTLLLSGGGVGYDGSYTVEAVTAGVLTFTSAFADTATSGSLPVTLTRAGRGAAGLAGLRGQ